MTMNNILNGQTRTIHPHPYSQLLTSRPYSLIPLTPTLNLAGEQNPSRRVVG